MKQTPRRRACGKRSKSPLRVIAVVIYLCVLGVGSAGGGGGADLRIPQKYHQRTEPGGLNFTVVSIGLRQWPVLGGVCQKWIRSDHGAPPPGTKPTHPRANLSLGTSRRMFVSFYLAGVADSPFLPILQINGNFLNDFQKAPFLIFSTRVAAPTDRARRSPHTRALRTYIEKKPPTSPRILPAKGISLAREFPL